MLLPPPNNWASIYCAPPPLLALYSLKTCKKVVISYPWHTSHNLFCNSGTKVGSWNIAWSSGTEMERWITTSLFHNFNILFCQGLKWNDTPCSFETFFICEVWETSLSPVSNTKYNLLNYRNILQIFTNKKFRHVRHQLSLMGLFEVFSCLAFLHYSYFHWHG